MSESQQPTIKPSPQNYHQNIPQALKDIPHWVLWTLIDNDKVPCTIRTAFQKTQATPIKWADTSTHLTFEQAVSYYTEHYDLPDLGGIGLILNKSHSANITCIDIDRLQSKLDQRIVQNQKLLPLLQLAHKTYTELSQSGNGLHLFINTSLLYDRTNTYLLELYPGNTRESNAFIAMTGYIPTLDNLDSLPAPIQEPLSTLGILRSASVQATTLCDPYSVGDHIMTLAQSIISSTPRPPRINSDTNSNDDSSYFRMPPTIAEGERHNMMNGYLCSLVSQYPSITLERLTTLAIKANQERCLPPLPDKELSYLIKHVSTAFRDKLQQETASNTGKYSQQDSQESDDPTPPSDSDVPDNWRSSVCSQEVAKTALLQEYVYITSENKFYDLRTQHVMGVDALNSTYSRWFSRKLRAAAWMFLQPALRTVAAYHWLPSAYDPISQVNPSIRVEGVDYLNAFKYRLKPLEGTAQPWLDLAQHLCPHDAYRSALIWYYAFMVQKPHLKCQWHPVMLGIEGAGKDSFIRPLASILPTKVIGTDEFLSPYDDYLYQTKLVILNEAEGLGKKAAAKYKLLTTSGGNDYRQLNIKGGMKVNQYDCSAFIIHSNTLGALEISMNNRRCFVLNAEDKLEDTSPLAIEYFHWLENDGAAKLFHYLLHYDLYRYDYSPAGLPYNTKYVSTMVDNAKSDIETDLLELLEHVDAVNTKQLRMLVHTYNGDSLRQIRDILHSNNWIRWKDISDSRIRKRVDGEQITLSGDWYLRKSKKVELGTPPTMYDACVLSHDYFENMIKSGRKY